MLMMVPTLSFRLSCESNAWHQSRHAGATPLAAPWEAAAAMQDPSEHIAPACDHCGEPAEGIDAFEAGAHVQELWATSVERRLAAESAGSAASSQQPEPLVTDFQTAQTSHLHNKNKKDKNENKKKKRDKNKNDNEHKSNTRNNDNGKTKDEHSKGKNEEEEQR